MNCWSCQHGVETPDLTSKCGCRSAVGCSEDQGCLVMGALRLGLEDGPILGPNSGRASWLQQGSLHSTHGAQQESLAAAGKYLPPRWDPEVRGRTWAMGHTYVPSLGAWLYPERLVLQRRRSRYRAKGGWRGPGGRWWEHSPSSGSTSAMASQRLPKLPNPRPLPLCSVHGGPPLSTLPGRGGHLLLSS